MEYYKNTCLSNMSENSSKETSASPSHVLSKSIALYSRPSRSVDGLLLQDPNIYRHSRRYSSIPSQSSQDIGLDTTSYKSRILIIYCGGTIGMKWTEKDGYVPSEGWLYDKLASMSEFHDVEYLKNLVKNGDPLDEYDREAIFDHLKHDPNGLGIDPSHIVSLLKLSQSPGHYRTFSDSTHSEQKASGSPHLKLSEYHRSMYPWLIAPNSIYDKRIFYRVLEYAPLLDSSNMTMDDWVKLATDIETFYNNYDAFIILHGTDTMAYTASALSFMLEELGKTVIVTGSQISICEFRNDAVNNLVGALTIAGHFVIPEVTLFFSNKLYRGNRVSKVNAVSFSAFDSPNMKPLAELGIHIEVAWDSIYRPWGLTPMKAHKKLDPNVATLRLFPGIPADTVASFLSPAVRGIVLETFGVGNAPSNRPDLLKLFSDASSIGNVVIVNVTECLKGQVHSDIYDTGRQLIEAGVVPGRDLTIEAALTKLAYLLGKESDIAKVRQLMTENIRGELTLAVNKPKFSLPSWTSVSFTLPRVIQSVMNALSHSGGEKSEIENIFWPPILASITAAGDTAALYAWEASSPSRHRLHEAIDASGKTLLHIAAENGLVDMVSFLLYHGLSVHVYDIQGHNPLMKALLLNHMQVSKLLIQTGSKVPIHDQFVFSLLYSFILEGNLDYSSMLLDAGIDPRLVNSEGRSVLYAAVYNQRYDVLDWVLSKISFEESDILKVDICNRTVIDEIKFLESKRGDALMSKLMKSRFPSLL